METFSFYLDEKLTIWARTKFEIEANSIEEAKEKAIQFVKDGKTSEIGWDLLEDTVEKIDVPENNNEPTEELFENNLSDAIWDNTRV